MRPIEIFFSYAHEDEELMDVVRRQLILFEREGTIVKWHDRMILPGQEWEGKIDGRLNHAQIILLFISPHFIESKYCYNIEMRTALRRHEMGKAKVIPVILRPCLWQDAPFGKLQALPKDGKPLTEWGNRDKAALNVAKGVIEVVKELNSVVKHVKATEQFHAETSNLNNYYQSKIANSQSKLAETNRKQSYTSKKVSTAEKKNISLTQKPEPSIEFPSYAETMKRFSSELENIIFSVQEVKENLLEAYPSEAFSMIAQRFEKIHNTFTRYSRLSKEPYYEFIRRSQMRTLAAQEIIVMSLKVAKAFEKYAKKPASYSRLDSRASIEELVVSLTELSDFCRPIL